MTFGTMLRRPTDACKTTCTPCLWVLLYQDQAVPHASSLKLTRANCRTCEKIMAIMATAAMGSSLLRRRVVGLLVQPVSICCGSHMPSTPLLSLMIRMLPLIQTSSTIPAAHQLTTSTLGLLLNATHNCSAVGVLFRRMELRHMAVMLLNALASIDQCMAHANTSTQSVEEATSVASGILCILINVAEQCSDRAVTLAELKVGALSRVRCIQENGHQQQATHQQGRPHSLQPSCRSCSCGSSGVNAVDPTENGRRLTICTCGQPQLTFIAAKQATSSRKRSPIANRRVPVGKRRNSVRPLLGVQPSESPQRRISAPAEPNKSSQHPTSSPIVRSSSCPDLGVLGQALANVQPRKKTVLLCSDNNNDNN